jgi:hypothetical protein
MKGGAAVKSGPALVVFIMNAFYNPASFAINY